MLTAVYSKHLGHSLPLDASPFWKELPDDVRTAPTLACLRKKLKSYIIEKAFHLRI